MIFYLLYFLLIVFGLLYLYQWYEFRRVYNVKTGSYLKGFGLEFNLQLFTLKTSIAKYIHENIKDYKEDLYVSVLGKDFKVMVKDHKLAAQILADTETYVKGSAFRSNKIVKRFIGSENVVFVNGEDWNRQRRSINPAFFKMEKFVTPFHEKAKGILAKMGQAKDGVVENIADYMQKMTLDVLGKTIFDFEFKSTEGSIQKELGAYNYLMEHVLTLKTIIMGTILNDYFPNSEFMTKFHENLEVFEGLIKGLVEKAKIKIKNGESENTWSMLEYLVQANMADDESKMSDEELRQNIIIFYLAGHETTSVALSYAITILAMNKDIQDKLRNEIKSISEKENGITYESVNKMEYLLCFIKETMRKYPPVVAIPDKTCTKDVQLGDYFIPKGTYVGINVYTIHHSEEVYGDPENFRPERWSKEEQLKRKIPNSAWIPFSAGSRVCVGNNFSLLEQKIFLSELLLNYEITALEKKEIEPSRPFGIAPPKALKIEVKKLK